ncbi:MAG TPA: hypothetical protein VGJ84_08820, partial [Polyangiaceae bacterium]
GQHNVLCGNVPQDRAFTIELTAGDTPSWEIEGSSVRASTDLPRCLGFELAEVEFVQDVALFAAERLSVGEGASITNLSTIPGRAADSGGAVVSSGTLEIEARARVGSSWSHGDARVGDGAEVAGDLIVGGTLNRGNDSISGAVVQRAYVPRHSLEWHVVFPVGPQENVDVSNSVQRLLPGSYGNVRVINNGTLVLRTGVYRTDSLSLYSGSTLELVTEAGPVVIYVQNKLLLEGTLGKSTQQKLLLGYFGSFADLSRTSFRGTFIAPDSQVIIGGTEPHIGCFLARRIRIDRGTQVRYAR